MLNRTNIIITLFTGIHMDIKTKKNSRKTNSSGFGETSKVNGLPKIHLVCSHTKRTKTGFTSVKTYRRSKRIR